MTDDEASDQSTSLEAPDSIPGSPASVSSFNMNQDNGAQLQMPLTPPGSEDESQYQDSPQSQDSRKGQTRSKEGTLCQLCDFKPRTNNRCRELQDHYGKFFLDVL